MSTDTILTPEEIGRIAVAHGCDPDLDDGALVMRLCRAIEQAVLQSPEIQARRKDAGRWRMAVETWRISKVEVFRGGTLTHPQSIPWETLTYQVDAAMEAQI